MKINCKILMEYKTQKDAEIINNSISVENDGFVESTFNNNNNNNNNNNTIEFNINSDSLNSFLRTVDDLIFSTITVEKVLNSISR
ncbi:MAG: hypothetical protein LBM96_03890 [Methanobrevibacter sp.]|jgi:hypothetical protein|nr:hypothetical protein [Candidatus Methanoflexus mossambicus]